MPRAAGAAGEEFFDERLQGLGAVVHAAEVAVGAAGFGVERICQLQDVVLQGNPVRRVAVQRFGQPFFDVFQRLKMRIA